MNETVHPNTPSWRGRTQLYPCARLLDHLKRASDVKVLLTLIED